MRYVIDVSQKQATEISTLLGKGKYQDFGQFFSIAIDNQLYIEKTDITQQPLQEGKTFSLKTKEYDDDNGRLLIDMDAKLTNLKNNTKILPMPNFNDLAYSKRNGTLLREEDVWLWGQINRIFPIKLGLRVLQLVLGDNETVELEAFRNKASDIALAFSRMIRSRERYNEISRDERVSAGLPIDNEVLKQQLVFKMRTSKKIIDDSYLKQEEFKSKIRYKMHFLAYMRKDKKLDGAMSCLRFVNLRKNENNKVFIGITKPGLLFSRIKNPIIDNSDFTRSLGENEIEFYLDHVLKNVNEENSAIKWLLGKLSEGITQRKTLLKEMTQKFSKIWGASEAVINTQRAGLMARMFELGLIDKKKEGVEVDYIISSLGKKFLETQK